MAARKTRRKKPAPATLGLTPEEVASPTAPPAIEELAAQVRAAGGVVLSRYRDPLGGSWLLTAALPLAQIEPTPFQRDLSEAHVKRLEAAIAKLGSFLDPVIAVAAPVSGEGPRFWTPNGLHRLSALTRLGARTITALISPDPALAYRILALNTEKAHNTKERALEAMRMARGLAGLSPDRLESDFALELEDGSLITLGLAYEERPRFAGGAYASVLKASDSFLETPLPAALDTRSGRAKRLLALDDRVGEIAKELKDRGFDSPYLRNFIVARIRPYRARGKAAPGPEALLEHMEAAAARFDVAKVRGDQVAKAAGAGE